MDDVKQIQGTASTSTLDLALRIVEFLAYQNGPTPLATIANEFNASKATVYRHLQGLMKRGFVRQDRETTRYDVGVKLMILGEASRSRFEIVSTARHELLKLRDATGQAVTICTLIDDEVVVLELTQGRAVVEFATRPGTRLALHASAHGKIWLAFGTRSLFDKIGGDPLPAWTQKTITSRKALEREVASVRTRGWSTAPDQVILGVNTLAAPVFDHQKRLVASIAIAGAKQFIPADPSTEQFTAVVDTARRISRSLGLKE